jgi:hypothetical protein
MPLTKKGKLILDKMKDEYGKERGQRVFYAAANKGTIKGVDFRRKKK